METRGYWKQDNERFDLCTTTAKLRIRSLVFPSGSTKPFRERALRSLLSHGILVFRTACAAKSVILQPACELPEAPPLLLLLASIACISRTFCAITMGVAAANSAFSGGAILKVRLIFACARSKSILCPPSSKKLAVGAISRSLGSFSTSLKSSMTYSRILSLSLSSVDDVPRKVAEG